MKTYYYSAFIKPLSLKGDMLIDGSISSSLKGFELAEEIKKKVRFDFKLDSYDRVVVLNVM